mmetsp:Transcript_4400/g.10663  ORF Transcript_4400/g.10663 Transcript_4400/m.10663 type:complete len:280 (+) Transcript_4400:1542-2381(+)
MDELPEGGTCDLQDGLLRVERWNLCIVHRHLCQLSELVYLAAAFADDPSCLLLSQQEIHRDPASWTPRSWYQVHCRCGTLPDVEMPLTQHAKLRELHHEFVHLENRRLQVFHCGSRDPQSLLLREAADRLPDDVPVATRLLHESADSGSFLPDEVRATDLGNHDLYSPLVLVLPAGGASGAAIEDRPDDAGDGCLDGILRPPQEDDALIAVHKSHRQLLIKDVDNRAATLPQVFDQRATLADDPRNLKAAEQQLAWHVDLRAQLVPQSFEAAEHINHRR